MLFCCRWTWLHRTPPTLLIYCRSGLYLPKVEKKTRRAGKEAAIMAVLANGASVIVSYLLLVKEGQLSSSTVI
jgi:hypothetical protein